MKYLLTLFTIVFFGNILNVQAESRLENVLNYIPANYQNISFSLWSMGAFDVQNDDAIDAYLQISKCPVFEKYRDDDFMWQNIREGQRREIEYFSKEYPNRFYIDSLIALGKYNFQNNRFELLKDFQFSDAGTIRFPFYMNNARYCGSEVYKRYFSRKVSFKSDTEYELIDIPVAPDKANSLLDEISQYRYPEMWGADRILPIRFEITVTGYELLPKERILLKGDMDRIQVFSDPQRQNPIWTKQFKLFD